MSLRHLVKPQATISLPDGQTFTVSGITPNHAFGLYHRHRGQLASLFDQVVGQGASVDVGDVASMGATLLNSAPTLMAEIIALAAGGNPFDETPVDPAVPDGATNWQAEVAAAAGLTMAVQLDALKKIGDLTFTPEMPPKKFLRALVVMMEGANNSISTPSSGD